MDILLIILGAAAVLLGMAGCVLPVLPGPPLAWAGLLILHFSGRAHLSGKILVISAIITAAIIAIDLILPVWVARRKGVSRAARIGVVVGMIVGLLFSPWGILAGPLAGAFLGELVSKKGDARLAFRAAWGAFTGFLFGTGLKLAWCLVMAWWFVKALL